VTGPHLSALVDARKFGGMGRHPVVAARQRATDLLRICARISSVSLGLRRSAPAYGWSRSLTSVSVAARTTPVATTTPRCTPRSTDRAVTTPKMTNVSATARTMRRNSGRGTVGRPAKAILARSSRWPSRATTFSRACSSAVVRARRTPPWRIGTAQ
jgi:hypothetical protein